KYRPNTGSGFGNLITLGNINRLEKTKSNTSGYGYDFNVGIGPLGLGKGTSKNKTKTETDSYFIDYNGDGLPDMISGNKIKFNVSDVGDDPFQRTFEPDVYETKNPIESGDFSADLLNNLEFETLDELQTDYPQFDPI